LGIFWDRKSVKTAVAMPAANGKISRKSINCRIPQRFSKNNLFPARGARAGKMPEKKR